MTGVAGAVDLRFGWRRSETVLAECRVDAPMKVVRPFPSAGGRLVVQLITLGPGLCAGDTLRVRVTSEGGARVVVTTPAAARIMAMTGGERAEQHVALHADARSSLEYYPMVAIPFPGSTFVQTVTVTAARDARVGVVEAWALGRPVVANGKCDVLKGQCLRSNAGLFYESYAEFLSVIQSLEKNRWLGATLGTNGRRFFREHYEWPVIERKYLDLLEQLVREPVRSTMEPLPPWIERRRRNLPPARDVVARLPRGASLEPAEAGLRS